MTTNGLLQFVKELEAKNELVVIKKSISPILEISEITDRVSKMPDGGKALLFENNGTRFPLLINAFGSEYRMAMVLGCGNLEDARKIVEEVIKSLMSVPQGFFSKIKFLPRLAKFASYLPKSIKGKGACQEVVMRNPDLSTLPVLQCWPGDGGRFFTLPMVITKNPITGIRNVGMYRMQVIDNVTTAMHWHPHKTGANHFKEYKKQKRIMPVAVALGGDPLLTYSATAPLPENIDEYAFVGVLRKKAVKLVKCITNDLEVPGEADIIIEGYVDPYEDMFLEGPFGDHTGFYSLPDYFPKFHVTCITYRKNAIYPATIVGIPPMEDAWIAKATEKIFIEPIRLGLLPEILDMHLPFVGVAHNLTLLSIDKRYDGHAQKVMNALWGAGQMMFNKIMVVFEKGVDLTNYPELIKKALANFNPDTDIYFGQGPLDILDHASDKVGFGSKIGIDCTHVPINDREGDNPDYPKIEPEVLEKILNEIQVIRKINVDLYNRKTPVLVVGMKEDTNNPVKKSIEKLFDTQLFNSCKIILIIDAELDVFNVSRVLWYCLNNIDPQRDVYIHKQNRQSILVVNGLNKSELTKQYGRNWPNVIISDDATIERIDAIWSELELGSNIPSPSLSIKEINKHPGAFYDGIM